MLTRKRHVQLLLDKHGISLDDFAYDCIADLFRRSIDGSFAGVQAYFSSIDFSSADDAELLVHMRRLVSSAVNQRIFGALNEIDPSLGKIIRNIKLSIHSLRTFTETETFGEAGIVPVLCDPLEHLQQYDRRELAEEIAAYARGNEKMPGLLAALANVLRHQRRYSRSVPIVVVALAFRDVYECKQLPGPHSACIHIEPDMMEIALAVDKACALVKGRVKAKYVSSGKVSNLLLDSYLEAIGCYFKAKLDGDVSKATLQNTLQQVIGKVDLAEYQRVHRSRLEYLARQVQKEIEVNVGNLFLE
jgi:hypothetical protein